MSAHELEKVIKLWELEKLTVEQAIGQILLLIKERDERLRELEGLVYSLRQELHKKDRAGSKTARSEM
jgi:hypothetical protein